MKDLLFNLFIGATLIVMGAIGGYLYSQMQVLKRFDNALKTERLIYDAGDLQYIVIGDTLTTDKN